MLLAERGQLPKKPPEQQDSRRSGRQLGVSIRKPVARLSFWQVIPPFSINWLRIAPKATNSSPGNSTLSSSQIFPAFLASRPTASPAQNQRYEAAPLLSKGADRHHFLAACNCGLAGSGGGTRAELRLCPLLVAGPELDLFPRRSIRCYPLLHRHHLRS